MKLENVETKVVSKFLTEVKSQGLSAQDQGLGRYKRQKTKDEELPKNQPAELKQTNRIYLIYMYRYKGVLTN